MGLPPPSTNAHPTIEHLLDEYSGWRAVASEDREGSEAASQLAALYRFAIANYSHPLAELLLDAIAAMEASQPE